MAKNGGKFWAFVLAIMVISQDLGPAANMARSDEGMWLFNQPPTSRLKSQYNVELSKDWLEHLQKASIRFNNGGSGSFISSNGLVITNHHIGADSLEKLSTAGKDLLKEGFLARDLSQERPCPDLELNILESIEDVTARVEAGVPATLAPAEAAAARRKVLADIELESKTKTGLRSDVVTLHHGGLYHLYRYRRFTDVRLVFAPESEIAGYGGDVDNFEFPRFNLDICLFRVYENGKPYRPPHSLKLAADGAKEGELVFVSGHPGTTQRLETLDKLKYRRDQLLPYSLGRLRNMEAALLQFSAASPEKAARAVRYLHSVANARKAMSGQLQGLLDSSLLAKKATQESALRSKAPSQDAWAKVKKAVAALEGFGKEFHLVETGHGFDSELFVIARQLVRLGVERAKPNGQRLREYRDSNKESLELSLFSPAPIHPELEALRLGTSLTFLAEQLGGDHSVVKDALGGQSPHKLAAALIAGTKLADVAFRKSLAAGGPEAIARCDDPMIQLARTLDATARALRHRHELEVEEPERQANGAISRLRFELAGNDPVAPDATFTLRLAFGTVKGYEAEGRQAPAWTTVDGLYERHAQLGAKEPFLLPSRWTKGKGAVPGNTPFNIVSTADTIGGNSGSPVVNQAGEFIGINFDRNRFGLVRNFVYTDVAARHIMVDARIIKQALTQLYGASQLIQEWEGQ